MKRQCVKLERKSIFKAGAKGFTLMEVMIAMIIISFGIIVITNAWNGNFLRVRKTAMGQEIVHLIERKMLDLEMQFRNQPASLPEEDEGDFGSDFPRYRWELKSREFEWNISAQVGELGDMPFASMMTPLMSQLQEYSRKVIKEIKLTVFVKNGKKEIPYSVATYFIDYSQPISVPALTALSAMGQQGQQTQQPQ